METLECVLCNFATTRTHDMKRHKESKKHIERLQKNLPEFPDKQPKVSIKSQNILKHESKNKKNANNANNNGNNANYFAQNNQQNQFRLVSDECCTEIEKKPKKVTNVCKCGKLFSHSSSLSRHKKICSETIEMQPTHENKYIEKIDNLEKQVAMMKTIIEKIPTNITLFNKPETAYDYNLLGSTINANKTMTDNSVNIDNSIKNVSVITYLNNNYTEAMPLKMLKSKDVTKMFSKEDIGNYSIEEIITFQQSKYMLDEFLGDVIIKKFTNTTNPKQQQIWISDVARLKFIVRGTTNKDQFVWQPDKKGIILTEKIITPMLDDIHALMTKHNECCSINIKDSYFGDQYDWLYKQSANAISVIYDINQKTLHHKILLHIAPHFQLIMDD